MTDDEDKDDPLDTRARIEKSLEGILSREALDALLKDVLEIKKQARGWCKDCGKNVPVEIPDAKAVVSAMSELLTQGLGRPGTDSQDGDGQTTVNVYYVTGCDSCGDEIKDRDGNVVEDPRVARDFADGDFPKGRTGVSTIIENGVSD